MLGEDIVEVKAVTELAGIHRDQVHQLPQGHRAPPGPAR